MILTCPLPFPRDYESGPCLTMSQDGPQLTNFCTDNWTWNKRDKSHEVRLCGENLKTAHFHPNWSNGTAGVRGTRILNRGRYYWEINVSQRIFGTSMMFGISTKKSRLHVNAFVNMLGEDEHGWGLSHKGLLWHNGKWRQYAKPFRENEATTIGILFDGIKGTLAYYKDGCNLGVAFTDLHLIQDELYPVVCSTAAKTEMSLGITKREFGNLQDRCRSVILTLLRQVSDVSELSLPKTMKQYLADGTDNEDSVERPRKGATKHNYYMRSSSCGPHRVNTLKNYSYLEENCKYFM
ncbi:SPRY domain-containing SOCS box protein 3 [Trichonephila inaurata madagascariensis]|uniref:SPRY domain-containing SOCS box protein 3 n=1 Tax=Trichonephila inaurata madagascariensis TaxID=2747483 RepID=A0A8X6XAW1_9ARAC|nr:SPRY domain-containing SOCS box protein 3 [Trichonephila inaurata madagascariensis]